MNIFIDESGSFATHKEPCNSVSTVGALIVPEWQTPKLLKKYAQLRPTLPQDKGEVKGRLLNERQVAKVLELMRKNCCIFESVAIDMGLETEEGLTAHRAGQAEALTRHLTDKHHPDGVRAVWRLRERLEAMALPLYAQSCVTIQLIGNILRQIPVYWAQRVPREILNFHWVIDGKEVGRITNAEEWWSTTMLGLLQSRSYRDPMIALEGIDCSDFDAKFKMKVPDWLKEHMPGVDEALNLQLLLRESFRFSSEPEPGLELADIVTNATRRALAGNLEAEGWAGIPRLMVHTREPYLKLVTLSREPSDIQRPYARLLVESFRSGGRTMLKDNRKTTAR